MKRLSFNIFFAVFFLFSFGSQLFGSGLSAAQEEGYRSETIRIIHPDQAVWHRVVEKYEAKWNIGMLNYLENKIQEKDEEIKRLEEFIKSIKLKNALRDNE